MTTPACPSYAGYRFPAEVISHAVWLYFRFPLSLRMVDELLAARGSVARCSSLGLSNAGGCPPAKSCGYVGDWAKARAGAASRTKARRRANMLPGITGGGVAGEHRAPDAHLRTTA